MNTVRVIATVLIVALMSVAGRTAAHAGAQYITIDEPNAWCASDGSTPGNGTAIYGIGLHGELVGYYTDASGTAHGFLMQGHSFTTIDPPGSQFPLPTGITGNGEVVGAFLDSGGTPHGFTYEGGAYTTFDVPEPPGVTYGGTVPFGVDPQGDVVGQYLDNVGSGEHAFVRRANGSYLTFDYPNELNPLQTVATGISQLGQIAGFYYPPYDPTNPNLAHSFVRQPNGSFTTFDVPGAAAGTYANAISLQGTVTGGWIQSSSQFLVHGFLRTPDGRITTFDDPSSTFDSDPAAAGVDQGTSPHGISPQGVIVGKYSDAHACFHGFVRLPG